MKRKLMCLLLAAAMVFSIIPEIGAVDLIDGAPNEFSQSVALPLMGARTSGLYDEPTIPLPDTEGTAFLSQVEGWLPCMPEGGALPVSVGIPDQNAVKISNAADLQNLTEGGSYVLTQDIDLTGMSWTPLTITGAIPFVLDGQGHTIKGMSVSAAGTDYTGLFGQVRTDMTVKNLRFDGAALSTNVTSVSGEFYHGTFVSRAEKTVTLENFVADDLRIVRSGTKVGALGGLFGLVVGKLTVTDCAVDVTISKSDDTEEESYGLVMGGLAARISNCELTRVFGRVDIDGQGLSWRNSSAWEGGGGLIGYAVSTKTVSVFRDCMLAGHIDTGTARAGGLVAYAAGPVSMENCVSLADLTARNLGGLAAYVGAGFQVTDCRYAGSLCAHGSTSFVGGLAGTATGSTVPTTIVNCAVKAEISAPDAGTEGMDAYVGGLFGRVSSFSMQSCSTKVEVSGFDGDVIYLGGLVGDTKNSADQIRDCCADLTSDAPIAPADANVGGLVGHCNNIRFANCGAKVDLSIHAPGEIGGLIGYNENTSQLLKCWSNGRLTIVATNVIRAGGLVGFPSYDEGKITIGQCYSGTDLDASGCRNIDENIGGLAGSGNCTIYSSWCDAAIVGGYDETSSVAASTIAGLVGDGSGSLRDCCFLGEVRAELIKDVSGILGYGNSTISNCYAKCSLSGGYYMGGILARTSGTSGKAQISDCWFEGSLLEPDGIEVLAAGGIAGQVSSGTIQRCSANTSLYATDGKVGGILADGSVSVVEDCSFTGSLTGKMVSGIAAAANSIYDCTVNATFDIGVPDGGNVKIGGIAIKASLIQNCHVENTISIHQYAEEDATFGTYYIGGIAAEGSKAVDCSSKGVYYRCTTASKSLHNMWVGGIVGRDAYGIENCRVDGNVYVKIGHAGLDIGGLVGGMEYYFAKNSSVNGDVVAEFESGACCAGGLIGSVTKSTILDCCYHTGSVHAWCADEDARIYTETPWVGNGNYTETNAPGFGNSNRPGEQYRVLAYGYRDDALYDYFPLSGATVTVNGKTLANTTRTDGSLTFGSEELDSTGSAKIVVEREGYFKAECTALLAHGGTVTFFLRERIPGKIYLTSAQVENSSGCMTELIGTKNTVRIPHTEKTSREMYFGVDWNDLAEEGRTLRLTNKDGSHSINLEQGNSTVFHRLCDTFDAAEDIYLRATALDSSGEEKKEEVLLPLKVQFILPRIHVESPQPPLGDHDGIRGIDALYGLDMGISVDNMADYAIKASLENGVLRVEFDDVRKTRKNKLFGTQGALRVRGALQAKAPTADATWEEIVWVDSVGVGIIAELDPILEHSQSAIYPSTPPIPIAYHTDVSSAVEGQVKVSGTIKEPVVNGEVSLEAEFGIIAGVGYAEDVTDVTLIVGPDMGAKGKLEGKLTTDASKDDEVVDAEVEGAISFSLLLKAFELEVDPSFQLGRFVWNAQDGIKVYGAGIELTSLEEESWSPVSRAYLAHGGGFRGDALATLSSQSEGNVAALYENIAPSASSALATDGDRTILYFTADNLDDSAGGTVVDHTALWYTALQNGAWSEPELVSGVEAGYPDNLDADGPFAVWVNSANTDTLAGLLTSTDICIAKDGQVIHTIDGGGYVTAPRVSSSADGNSALVTWLSDDSVDGTETLTAQSPTLHYALYDGTTWTEKTVDTQGCVIVSAQPDLTAGRIYWKTEAGTLYTSTGSTYQNVTEKLVGVGATAHSGLYTASMADDGTLTIWNDTALAATLDTQGTNTVRPVMLTDGSGTCHVVWLQADGIYYADSASGWKAKLLTNQGARAYGLSAALVNGLPVTAFCRADNYSDDGAAVVTHLYAAAAPNLSGSDLAVTGLTYDDTDLRSAGLLKLVGSITNLRETPVTGFTYTVTDEEGQTVFTGSQTDLSLGYGDTQNCYAVFTPEMTQAHTYTLSAASVEVDANDGNNAASISPEDAPAIVSTTFIPAVNGRTGLEALIGNTGVAPTQSLTVEVFRTDRSGQAVGSALASETFTDVLSGSYRQVLLDEADSDTYYTVILSSEGEVLDNRLLMYSDPQRTGAWITAAGVEEDGTARISLVARELDESVQVLLALYESDADRMVFLNAATLAAWEGAKDVGFDLASQLGTGNYRYSVFLLDSKTQSPMCQPYRGTVEIS